MDHRPQRAARARLLSEQIAEAHRFRPERLRELVTVVLAQGRPKEMRPRGLPERYHPLSLDESRFLAEVTGGPRFTLEQRVWVASGLDPQVTQELLSTREHLAPRNSTPRSPWDRVHHRAQLARYAAERLGYVKEK